MSQFRIRVAALMLLTMLIICNGWAENVSYYDPTEAVGQQMKTANATALTNQGNLNSGWYYVSGNVTNNNRININGTVIIILTDSCRFTAYKGFRVTDGNTLKIYAQSANKNRGSLTANHENKKNHASIGGNEGTGRTGGVTGDKGEDAGNVTIYGGNITVNGNIGGGKGGSGGGYSYDDLYFGGTGGNGGYGGIFTFFGGNVTVTGFIGGGDGGEGQNGTDGRGFNGHTGGGAINLSWTHPADRIRSAQYHGTVTLQKELANVSNGNHETASTVAGKTLRPAANFPSVTIGRLPIGMSVETDLIASESGGLYSTEGQAITFSYSAPEGFEPNFTVFYGYNKGVLALIDNADRSYTFTMPNTDVSIELPNLVPGPNDVTFYDPTAYAGDRQRVVLQPTALADQTSLASGWYYVSGNVTIGGRIAVNGTVNLILTDGCQLNATNGIHVASGNTLNIYSQSTGNSCGSLTAGHSQHDAAIGGNGGADGDHSLNADQALGSPAEEAGNITIYGGNITTTGNIGGGDGGTGYSYTEYYGGGEDYDYFGGIGGAGGSCGIIAYYGGIITVNGAVGGGNGGYGDSTWGQGQNGANGSGTVKLSWTYNSDRYYAVSYNGTVTLMSDFVDSSDNQAVTASTIGGKTIKPVCFLVSLSPELLAALPADEQQEWENIYAYLNETVTFRYSAVPAGKIPQFSVKVDYGGGTIYYEEVYENGDGTYYFYMPEVPVTILGVMRSDIRECTAKMPNQKPYIYCSNKHDYYPLSQALSLAGDVEYNINLGEEVKDGNTILSLNSDYSFGNVLNRDKTYPTEDLHVCGKYLVEIQGKGNYYGTTYAPIIIVDNTVSDQTWGDLTWSLASGTLSITGTGEMMAAASNKDYPWYPFSDYFTTVSVDEGVTSIADKAFEVSEEQYTNPYAGLATVTLPSTITSIGDLAFAYCDQATITTPAGTTVGNHAFLNVNRVVGNLGNNATNNTGLIASMLEAQNADAILSGRTLYKDGYWNTLCLPFDLTVANSPLAGATVMALIPTTSGLADNTLTLNFSEVSAIEAGKPYLVKWATPGENLVNPEFNNPALQNANPEEEKVTTQDGFVSFVGTYDAQNFLANDTKTLFMSDNNTLYYPDADMTMGACRAFFRLSSQAQAPSRIVLNFNGENDATTMQNLGQDDQASKFILNGQLFIRHAGVIYDTTGRIITMQ